MSRSSSPVAHRGENPSRVSRVRSIDSSGGAITLPGRQARAPHAGSAVEQPSETEATPLPPSAPSLFRGRTTPWASAHQALANRAAAHRATAHRVSAGGGLEELDVPAGVVKSATAHRGERPEAEAADQRLGVHRGRRVPGPHLPLGIRRLGTRGHLLLGEPRHHRPVVPGPGVRAQPGRPGPRAGRLGVQGAGPLRDPRLRARRCGADRGAGRCPPRLLPDRVPVRPAPAAPVPLALATAAVAAASTCRTWW